MLISILQQWMAGSRRRGRIPGSPVFLPHVDRSLAHVGLPAALLAFAPEAKIHARALGGKSVAAEAERDDAVVVRPHRASLIRERVERRVVGRQGANPPAAP